MEVFQHTLLQMAVLSTAVILGVLGRKLKILNDDTDTRLSQVVMTFAIPCLILDSVLGNTNLPSSELLITTFGYSTLASVFTCLFAVAAVSLMYRKAPKASKGIHMFLISFGNTGQIGFAVLAAIFGSTGVLYGAICNIPYTFFMFSVGVVFILSSAASKNKPKSRQEKNNQLKLRLKEIIHHLLSPCLIASLISMFLAMYGITDSGYIGQTCELIGGMTIPLSMLVIGSTLSKQPIKEMLTDAWAFISSALRLLVVPLMIYFLGGLVIPDQTVLSVIAIQAAMPAAVAGTMMCLSYGGDTLTMTRATFITTVLSLLTMPLIAAIVV